MRSLTIVHSKRETPSSKLCKRRFREFICHPIVASRLGGVLSSFWLGISSLPAADVRLAWNANPESDIAGYRVSYGTSATSRPNTVNTAAVTSATVSGLTAGNTYYFAVQAINQGGLTSDPSAVISYQVPSAPVNAAPVAANRSVTTNEDQAVAVTLSATDANGDPLTYSIVSQPTKGTLGGSGANRTYTPNADANGADSFTYRANDGTANSNTATVSITINPVNDAPVAANQSVNATAGQTRTITLGASDKEGSSLSFSIVSQPTKGTLGGSGANRTYTPNAGATGNDSFTFRANDGSANSNTATVSINIAAGAPVNAAPVAANRSVTTNEDQAVAVVLVASDANGDPLSYSIVSPPTRGTLSGSGASRTYTPNADVNGTDSFTYRANDGTTNSNTATVSITINPVNDAPVAASQSVSTNEDQQLGIMLSASDKEGSALSYSILSPPTKGTLGGSGANRTYTPNADVNGTDSFTFRVNDGSANSNTATVSVTIRAINDAPVAASQSLNATPGQTLAIRLSASDKEGSFLSYSIVSPPTKGTLPAADPSAPTLPTQGSRATIRSPSVRTMVLRIPTQPPSPSASPR